MGFDHLTLDYEREMLKKEKLPEPVKKAIFDYVDETLLLEELSEKRRQGVMQRLRVIARNFPDDFLNPNQKFMKNLLIFLSKEYEPWTKVTYFRILKKYYRQTLKKSQFEKLFDGVKVKQPKPKVTTSDLITQDEMYRIIENCKNARDRAIFSTLYDSGCRIGELLKMKVGGVRMDSYGAILEVPWETKTGFRNVRIVGDSIAYLRAWLDSHPYQNKPEAWLFCNIADEVRGNRMTYDDVYSILRKVTKRAGITKRIHPHLFRHTHASLLASKPMSADVFEDQMGWISGSKQRATYVHLSGKQTDIATLKALGIEVDDEKNDEAKPKKCPRCGEFNASNSSYCRKCWLPLTIEATYEIMEKEDHIQKELESKGLIDDKIRALIENMPESERTGILTSIIQMALNEKEKSDEKKDNKK